MGEIQAFQTLLGKQGPMAGPATLLTLPDELLTLIAMELPQGDLLKARTTCQALRRVCATDQVWRRLFLISLGSSIPTPFFLPQPISETSANVIERSLRLWHKSVVPDNPVRHALREVRMEALAGRDYFQNTVTLLPGGRWVLVGYADGSVWYFDLSGDWNSTSTIEPKLLIPGFTSKTDASIDDFQMEVVLDWASAEALGPSVGTHALRNFNIAVLTCPDREHFNAYSEPMQVNVWGITVSNGPQGEELELGEHLSAFSEDPTPGLTGASLLGPMLAYANSAQPHRYVAIVDWRKANGRNKSQSLERRCISFSNDIDILRLVPGERILVLCDASVFTLYNWELDCQLTKEAPHEAISHGLTSPLLVWKFETNEYILHLAISHPLTINNIIRIPIPTGRGLYVLTIPANDYARDAIHFKRVVASALGEGIFVHIAHFKRAVGLKGEDNYKRIYYAEYPWVGHVAGEGPSNSAVHTVDYPFDDLGTVAPGNLLFDQYSGRVVVTDHDGTRFFTVLAPLSDSSPSPVSQEASAPIADGTEGGGGAGEVEPPTKGGLDVVEGAEEKGVGERGPSAEVGATQGISTASGDTVALEIQGEQAEVEEKRDPPRGVLLDKASTDESSDSTRTEERSEGTSGGYTSDESSEEQAGISSGERSRGLLEAEDSGEAPNRRGSTSLQAESDDAQAGHRLRHSED